MKKGDRGRKPVGGAGSSVPRVWEKGISDVC